MSQSFWTKKLVDEVRSRAALPNASQAGSMSKAFTQTSLVGKPELVLQCAIRCYQGFHKSYENVC